MDLSAADQQRAEQQALWLEQLLADQLAAQAPDIARLSVALGAVEAPLTARDAALRRWPRDLAAEVEAHLSVLEAFVAEASAALGRLWPPPPGAAPGSSARLAASAHSVPSMPEGPAGDSLAATRAKVKAVADLVWGRLTGSFSKDMLHAQHVYSFTQILLAGKAQAKRHLDCAGVVTTVLAVCQRLARQPGHEDLAACRFQVSEDHCWVSLAPSGAREASVEVTTDTAARRGLPVSAEAWAGWLYSGGSAVLCTPQMLLAALVTSLNPAITPRQNSGTDAPALQALQRRLLELLRRRAPAALYPAAACALADLREIELADELEAAGEARDAGAALAALERQETHVQVLFEEAILRTAAPVAQGGAGGCQWYPYSYLVGHLARRAEHAAMAVHMLALEAAAGVAQAADRRLLELVGAGAGAAVLRKYRYQSTDEQLYKDVEGVLEHCCAAVKRMAAAYAAVQQREAAPGAPLIPVLELWDGICCLFAGRAKPSGWVQLVLRTAKLFDEPARVSAAASAQVASSCMQAAQPHWRLLKPGALRQLFETPDAAQPAAREAAVAAQLANGSIASPAGKRRRVATLKSSTN